MGRRTRTNAPHAVIRCGTSPGGVADAVQVHDLHATMLHLLGIDHKRLTYRFQGRNFRLTDVSGQVIKPILA
jgi:hypothetical protein